MIKKSLIKFSYHAKGRLERLHGLDESFVRRDLWRNRRATRKKIGEENYKIHTPTAVYFFGKNLVIITIMYRDMARKSKKRRDEKWREITKEEYLNLFHT